MKLLEDKIVQEGNVLGEDILKVDGFINHQVGISLMEEIGRDMAEHFKDAGVTKVFTIESSGIAPSVFTAKELGVPLVILKKQNPKTLRTEVWQTGGSLLHQEHLLSADSGEELYFGFRSYSNYR